jgi:hypothetical protein
MMFSIKSKPLGTFILCAIDDLFNVKMTQTLTALGPLLIKILHSNHSCGYYNIIRGFIAISKFNIETKFSQYST